MNKKAVNAQNANVLFMIIFSLIAFMILGSSTQAIASTKEQLIFPDQQYYHALQSLRLLTESSIYYQTTDPLTQSFAELVDSYYVERQTTKSPYFIKKGQLIDNYLNVYSDADKRIAIVYVELVNKKTGLALHRTPAIIGDKEYPQERLVQLEFPFSYGEPGEYVIQYTAVLTEKKTLDKDFINTIDFRQLQLAQNLPTVKS